MTYNMSFLETSNTLPQILSGVNTSMGANIFPLLLLSALFLILMASFRSYDVDKVFMISSFATAIVASLLLFMGLVAWWVVIIFIILFLISLLVHYFN